jgi:signal transduction histidine kinase
LNHTGINAYPPVDPRYRWFYAPLLLLPFVGFTLWQSDASDFIANVGGWRLAYLLWLIPVNLASIWLFMRLRGKKLTPQSDKFLLHLSIIIGINTVIAVSYASLAINTPLEAPLRLLSIVSPLAVALLFVWHSMRGRLLPVVMERTFIYAVSLLSLLLIHRVLLAPMLGWARTKTNIDFFFVEGILVAAVILLVPSLRTRVAESLRQLFSTNVVHVRNAIRQVALKLSQNAGRDATELTHWFADELRRSIELDYVAIALHDENDKDSVWIVRSDESQTTSAPHESSESLLLIHLRLNEQNRVLELGAIEDNDVEQLFVRSNALLAFRMSYRSVTGSVILGNRKRNDRLGREQVHVLSIVVDQFAATVDGRREETRRQRAERKILQQEKLSVLGLLSGSLAHELRNPLSSIRTITTLVIEDLGESHEARHGLQMVVAEIDRLSQTTNRLLDYARPEPQSQSLIRPDRVISRIVCVLDYLAKQTHVEMKLSLQAETALIDANEASLSEIVFNLVKNAIEAAGESPNGHVDVSTKSEHGEYLISVCDNGSGIDAERRATLFQPFATSKIDGNGLGLYAVNERARELGGQVQFHPHEPCGSVFEVRLPIARNDDHSGS